MYFSSFYYTSLESRLQAARMATKLIATVQL